MFLIFSRVTNKNVRHLIIIVEKTIMLLNLNYELKGRGVKSWETDFLVKRDTNLDRCWECNPTLP